MGCVFNVGESRIHTAQYIYSMGGSCGLGTGKLTEIVVHEAHQAEPAEGDNLTRVIAEQA